MKPATSGVILPLAKGGEPPKAAGGRSHQFGAHVRSGAPLRQNRKLQVTGAVRDMVELLRKVAQLQFTCVKILRPDVAASDQFERVPYESRRMVKAGFNRDPRIMQGGGFDLDFRPSRAAAEEIDRSAAPHH